MERAKLGRAAGKDQRLIVDCGRDIGLGEVFLLQFSCIEIDRDESRLAPERERNRDPRNTDQADANLIQGDIESLLFGKCGAADSVLQNGNSGGVVLDDERRRCAGGQLSQYRLGDGGDLGNGG